jgi:hypothetical protein
VVLDHVMTCCGVQVRINVSSQPSWFARIYSAFTAKKKTVIAGSPRYPENGMSSLDQKHGIVK